MESDRASLTAKISAFARAFHYKHCKPLIFSDNLAEKILGDHEYRALATKLAASSRAIGVGPGFEGFCLCPDEQIGLSRVMRSQSLPIVVSRARYTEDMLLADSQVKQYVILGAGLDTFALRRLNELKGLTVFEVDHPSTQTYKASRLCEAGLSVPPRLYFVPCNFQAQTIDLALERTCYSTAELTFSSWLGVTYYLTCDSVLGVLKSVASICPSGSTIVFDYLDRDALTYRATPKMRLMRQLVTRAGEPLLSAFEPAQLHRALADIGLVVAEDLGPEEIDRLYFVGRPCACRAFEHVRFLKAIVH